jgi:hypothetical protein
VEWAAELWSTIGPTQQVVVPDAPVRVMRAITRVSTFGPLTCSLAISYWELASNGTPAGGRPWPVPWHVLLQGLCQTLWQILR